MLARSTAESFQKNCDKILESMEASMQLARADTAGCRGSGEE